MMTSRWIKGFLILCTIFFLGAWALQMDAWARAGSGRSMGSRGSRSAAPVKPYTAPTQPTQPRPSPGVTATPRPTTPPPVSQPSSFWRSFGGGLLGGIAGGLLFHSLFGGPGAMAGGGGGLGGSGISLLDILLLAGIAYLIYWYVRKRRQQAEATAGPYQSSASVEMPYQSTYPPVYDEPQAPARDLDLEKGLGYIRQMDPYFDEAKFQDMCMDVFFKIQGAWANRNMSSVRSLLTDEMYQALQSDTERFKSQGRINRLENIAVRSVDLTEAWQESGTDFITVRVYANLLDYTVDESSGQVLEGSKTDPVKFEEYWTFTRPVGNNAWQLSAINQAP